MNNDQLSAKERKEVYEKNQTELNKRKGELQQKHGIIFHKEMVALFDFQQEIHQEQIIFLRQEFEEQIKQTNQTNQELIKQWKLLYEQSVKQQQANTISLNKATAAIEKSSQPLHTQSAWAALWFSFNRYAWFAILPALLLYAIFHHAYITEEYENISTIVNQYKNIKEYRYLSESGVLLKNPNNMKGTFLQLKKGEYNKGEVGAGTNYFLSETKDQILVPLYFSK